MGAALPVLALSLNLFVQIKVPILDEAGRQVMKDGLALMQTVGWARHHIGDNFVNIGTYALVAVAMVVGSLLKPKTQRA